MIRVGTITLVTAVGFTLLTAMRPLRAAEEEAGLADLDKATELQVTAESAEDIDEIIKLSESALEKGLNEGNQQFARQLASSSLYRRASLLSAALFDQQITSRQARRLWQQALADLEKAVSYNDQFADAYLLTAQLQSITGGDTEKARQAADKAVELLEGNRDELPAALLVRAQLREEPDQMLKDVERVLELAPDNTDALLIRARIYQLQGEPEKAKADLDQALKLQPDLLEAVLLRIGFAEAEGRYRDAIEDVRKLLRLDPDNVPLRLQLALYYSALDQPRAAIEMTSAVLEDDPGNWQALRIRGDSQLSVGEHAKALEDYEKALQQQAEEPGLLNNLAWTLATSPLDELRDGKRSLELATKAAELTQHQEAYILSTLAAAYAETGDFENAIKWSTKAVEMSDEEIKEALQKELESYKQNKPWREMKTDPAAEEEQESANDAQQEPAADDQEQSQP